MEGIYLWIIVMMIMFIALGIAEFLIWIYKKIDMWQTNYRLKRNYKKLYAFTLDHPEIGMDNPEDYH